MTAPTTDALDHRQGSRSVALAMLNKVPEVTVYFWLIKVLATTVGETAADYLDETLGFGLHWATVVMSALLVGLLVWQFGLRRYVAPVYWAVVVVISVVGTLITDNLTDGWGVPLTLSTAVFAVLLAVTFAAWYGSEHTLSIHSIVTTRREGFYWLAILFTFALGTAAGDLAAEKFSLGYGVSVLLFAGAIALVVIARLGFNANAVLTFWMAYILTRPLGASFGDLMSQSRKHGGLGLGTTGTSALFLTAILVLVVFLTLTRVDRTEVVRGQADKELAA